MKTVLVALGGNSLLKKGEKPGISTQFKNASATAESLVGLLKKNRVVLTHGNGPQVGNILIQVESALGKAYAIPLEVAVAESEGEIGYVIQQSLHNSLQKHGIKRMVASVLTQVIVDSSDPSFRKPSKPVGPFYSRQQAKKLGKKGFVVKKVVGGYRRVVASPKPLEIVESKVIQALAARKVVVIAAGGGGIPVVEEKGFLKGVPAVVDKDLASAVLAKNLGASLFIMLTDVDAAYVGFGSRKQSRLESLDAVQARKLLKQGQFPAGSMGPKIEAAIDFVRATGGNALITNAKSLAKAMHGKAGTWVRL